MPDTQKSAADRYLLRAEGLTKRFGSLTANQNIDLEVKPGSIHAILGENGAGKSTLMKMLYGVYEPDDGKIYMDGEAVSLHPPSKAKAKGIGMVFQDFRLIPAMTVLDNIALAVSNDGWRLKRKQLREHILSVSEKYGLSVQADAYVWQLDLGERQRLEIVKVLLVPGTRVIIFDEPTSVLVSQEVEAFLRTLDLLRKDGYGILLITHKINEVLACADQVTVLRSGQITYQAVRGEGLQEDTLIAAMMGTATLKPVIKRTGGSRQERHSVLRIECGTIVGNHGEMVLKDIELCLKQGEITGVAGISGNGQRELAETLFGLRGLSSGTITIHGKQMIADTKSFIEAGVSLVSEDPLKESVIPGFTILEHMVLDGFAMKPRGVDVDWRHIRSSLEGSEEARALALADADRRADRLSGGNVQRLVLARALIRRPEILIISYPSRGLDIGTTHTIQQQLVALAERGTAVLLFSEDLDELFKLSDSLIVLSGKRLYGPYAPSETDTAEIGLHMLKGESA